uniref:(northern house mosquito) hypothetical protein n=1 Tax=Culex pipiens TaxID=7175 RepID=A0A8D8FQP5_CULPI
MTSLPVSSSPRELNPNSLSSSSILSEFPPIVSRCSCLSCSTLVGISQTGPRTRGCPPCLIIYIVFIIHRRSLCVCRIAYDCVLGGGIWVLFWCFWLVASLGLLLLVFK